MEILGFSYDDWLVKLEKQYGKGSFHSTALWKHLYSKGSLQGLKDSEEFKANPSLASRIERDFPLTLPKVQNQLSQDGTQKFSLTLEDGSLVESVIIPMHDYWTLCISSQVGCARNCSFCRTARMGLIRNLTTAEIVAQYFYARFSLGVAVRNIVFMGMGEPLDNLDNVLKAVDIFSHNQGLNIFQRRISISTCGQGAGLLELNKRIKMQVNKRYDLMPLCISLNGVNNQLRDKLMPVNRKWPLEKLKEILLQLPHSKIVNKLYLEYILIPGVNDKEEDAIGLEQFLDGITAKVNLIPLNAPEDSPYRSASNEDMQSFWLKVRAKDISCRSRKRKGDNILAACGQLATDGEKSNS